MYEATVDAATANRLAGEGYEIVSTEQVQGGVRIVLVLYPWERKAIEKQGIDVALWTNTEGVTATELARQQRDVGFKVFQDYDGSDGVRAYLDEIAAANPDLLKLEVIGETHGTDPEGDGADTPREIVALRLTADANSVPDNSRPATLYTSLQHAREWISVEVNQRLLEWLIKMYREDRREIVNLLQTTELWFVLVANPDGYQYTFDYDRLWRKNLRDNDGDNRITPNDGVDPNRNFPVHWNFDDEGSASITADQTYRGPAPASEPETEALIGLYDRVDFRFHVNYHSFGELLLYSFGFQLNTPSADDPIFVALSGTDDKPAIDGYNPGVGGDLYMTNGETTDYAHAVDGALGWTPELGDGPHDDGFVFSRQGRSGPSRVLQEPALRPVGCPVDGGSRRSRVAHQDRDRAVLPQRRGDRPAEELEPDERLPVRALLRRRRPAGAGAGEARHRRGRRGRSGHAALLGQRRGPGHRAHR